MRTKKLTKWDLKRSEKIRKIAIFMLENPKMPRLEIAKALGFSYDTLCDIIRESDLLQAVRGQASLKIMSMIPMAIQGFEDSLQTRNDKIKFLASQELLKSEKILGPERIDVTLTDTSQKSIEEMQAIIKEAQGIPSPTIDAELIS